MVQIAEGMFSTRSRRDLQRAGGVSTLAARHSTSPLQCLSSFAFVKAFQDLRAPWYLRGFIGQTLREIGVILLHDVEHCFLGELAMVLDK